MHDAIASLRVTLILAAAFVLACAASADLIWWDGSRDPGSAPPGKLLSDNIGYYGECVLTGVDGRIVSLLPSGGVGDTPMPDAMRLFDGQTGSGITGSSQIVIVFDFKRNCTFCEMDVISRTRKVGTTIEIADSPDNWRVLLERRIDDSPDAAMHRIKLPEQPQGRYVRLTVVGSGKTSVDEFLAWGDAEVTPDNPEAIRPTIATLPVVDWCAFSIPGIDKMGVVFNEFRDWKALIGDAADLPAIWSQVPTWDGITERPILPDKDKINKPVELVMARNEIECAAIALTNIGWPDAIETWIKVGSFRRARDGSPALGIKGRLRVAGAVPSSIFGVVLGPLFEADNMPGLSVLKRYTTNGEGIHAFPKVNLPAMTSAVMWLSVETDGAAPGVYEAELSCSTPGAPPLKVKAEVVDVTLPDTFPWVVCYSYETRMFPFQHSDRLEREVAYRKSLGLNVYHGFPNPGSLPDVARKAGPVSFLTYGVSETLTKPFRDNTATAADEQALGNRIRALVREAEAVGLRYEDWALELWDEPNKEGCEAYGRICEVIHRVEPKLQMYCNPTTYEIGNWYNKHIAVSVPFFKAALWSSQGDRVFNTPRPVRAFYVVATNSAKGERTLVLERYRKFAWDAIARGWNGWGFYAYYRPEGDPWSDFDRNGPNASPDFQMVYPGPRGPIATRHSEAVREGYEDYRLMHLLRQQGKKRDVDAVIKAYKAGTPLRELRLKALRAAAK